MPQFHAEVSNYPPRGRLFQGRCRIFLAGVKVHIEKRGEHFVGVLERPIDPQALKEALADFP